MSKHVHKSPRKAATPSARSAATRTTGSRSCSRTTDSEDDERRGLEEVQKITDGHIKLIDELQKKKDQELLGH